MAKKAAVKWSESMVLEKLASRFPPPEFVTLAQVRNGTGYQKKTRTADVIIISTWPSRGIHITGVEIKVSKADWRKELASPDKAESFQKYCKYWYVAAPMGIIPLDEVPDNWGLLEVTESRIRTTKQAKETEESPIDMPFVAAVLRKASETMMHSRVVKSLVAEKDKSYSYDRELAEKYGPLAYNYRVLKETVDKFESASGVSIGSRWDAGDIGDAVKIVRDNSIDKVMSTARRLHSSAVTIVKKLDQAFGGE